MKKRLQPDERSEGGGLPLDTSLFSAGERVCVAVSGGADSVALLRALLARQAELGIVLSLLHVEHGLRGAASNLDAGFVAALARESGLDCEMFSVDTPRRAAERKESIEDAARNLRYEVFRELLAAGKADKIATGHTLDDQAETVLMKLLRGAWTEGLSGIHPVLRLERGASVRPLLATSRAQIEAYLNAQGQSWREDESNASPDYTRNRVRHELLPSLREYNPRIAETLARMAANARAEEEHWQAELARWLPQLLLPGKPARGGGRRVSSAAVALDIARLRGLDAGLRRRVLRAAAERCGATLDFHATERLLGMMSGTKPATARLELPGRVRVERSPRELRFELLASGVQVGRASRKPASVGAQYELPVPGCVDASEFGAVYRSSLGEADGADGKLPPAWVRAWRPGDRVQTAHSRGWKKVKEVLERLGVRGEERGAWPVVEWQGRIVWIRGVEVASEPETASLLIVETRQDYPAVLRHG